MGVSVKRREGNPQLLDKVIGEVQDALAANLAWLDKAFGRAERVTRQGADGRVRRLPAVWLSGNDYAEVGPDSGLGNFSFFWVDDPQRVDWEPGMGAGLEAPFSLVFWFDLRRVHGGEAPRDKEGMKRQALDLLAGGFRLRSGRLRVSRVYELAENIYRGFSLDELDNQFLMHPYGGFRLEGTIEASEACR